MTTTQPTPIMETILAITLVVMGGMAVVGSAVLFVPAWRAAHGGGRVGVFTLTEAIGCDRYPPPKQRCGWFGEFVSDDGTVRRHHAELSGDLAPGAKLGDTVRARDAGSPSSVFQEDDKGTWKPYAIILGGSSGAFLAGFLILAPWRWLGARRGSRGEPQYGPLS